MMNLDYLSAELFTWSRWRSGSISDFKIPCRSEYITSPIGKRILREHAVGYCDASNLLCRPKPDQMAVMFFKDGYHFWNHLTKKEFNRVFDNESKF